MFEFLDIKFQQITLKKKLFIRLHYHFYVFLLDLWKQITQSGLPRFITGW